MRRNVVLTIWATDAELPTPFELQISVDAILAISSEGNTHYLSVDRWSWRRANIPIRSRPGEADVMQGYMVFKIALYCSKSAQTISSFRHAQESSQV